MEPKRDAPASEDEDDRSEYERFEDLARTLVQTPKPGTDKARVPAEADAEYGVWSE